MSILHARSVWSGATVLAAALLLSACTEEKKEPLPDLPPVELPKEMPGLYSGSLPCDDCNSKIVRMTLKEDMSVEAIQTTLRETVVVDTLKGTFVVTDSTVKVSLSDNSVHWNFKRLGSGNLGYLTSAGTVYEDDNGFRADFIRIYKVPTVVKPVDSDSTQKAVEGVTKE